MEFCFENKIVLCRLPSHTSHELQPCDVAAFGPLKASYREQVERLERGGVNNIGKQHFTYLYSPARRNALRHRSLTQASAQFDASRHQRAAKRNVTVENLAHNSVFAASRECGSVHESRIAMCAATA